MGKEKNKAVRNLSDKEIAMKVSIVTIIINLILSILKFFAGIVGKSGAMISDAIHSASDVFSTFIVIVGVNLSNKKSDKEHQYGHERLECVASIILAVILFIIGAGIGIDGIEKVILDNPDSFEVPSALALIAAIVSIVVKEWMYWYTRAAAKKINSGALMADAWHNRSDSLSSIGALIGIAGAILGHPILDTVASIVISIFIIKAAYEVFKDSIDKLVDKSCDEETINKMRKIIENQDGVIDIDELKTRLFGNKIYVDIEISANANLSLNEAHSIAQKVHDSIERQIPLVKHCMVHVNPK